MNLRRAGPVLAVTMTVSICLMPDGATVTGFEDVHGVPAFWVKTWDITSEEQGLDFAGVPQAFKDCAGEQAVKMSPPNLTRAVEQFIATKHRGDYKALVSMVREFSAEHVHAYGVSPGFRAGQLCAAS